jgi:hypothetical protein
MGDTLSRLAWFFIVSSAVAYVVFLVVGATIHARAIDASRIVTARDVLKANEHRLSGMVMVQSTCAQLSVRAEQMSPTVYHLEFSTWEAPSVECEIVDVPRAFQTVVFAPATGVDFVATLDGEELPLVVIPTIDNS